MDCVQGPLAQFSRSELVCSLVAQIVREFGQNLEARATGKAVAASGRSATGLNAFGFFWRWLRGRFAEILRPRNR